MNKEAFIDWLRGVKYSGRIYTSTPDALAHVHASLSRLDAHLAANWGGIEPAEMPFEALKTYPFQQKVDDDGVFGPLMYYLNRPDLGVYMGQVSARKFFMNKLLIGIFKDMPELVPAMKALGRLRIRMAHELLAAGAAPAGRDDLAEKTDLPLDTILLMVKSCDLCRMTGMGGQALRRSLAMGYDTLAKFRAAEPDKLTADVQAYFVRTGERTNVMIDYASYIYQARSLADEVTW